MPSRAKKPSRKIVEQQAAAEHHAAAEQRSHTLTAPDLGHRVPRKRRSGTMLQENATAAAAAAAAAESVLKTPSSHRQVSVSSTPSLRLNMGPPPPRSVLKLHGPRLPSMDPPPPPSQQAIGFQPTFGQAMNSSDENIQNPAAQAVAARFAARALTYVPPTPSKSTVSSSQWLRRPHMQQRDEDEDEDKDEDEDELSVGAEDKPNGPVGSKDTNIS